LNPERWREKSAFNFSIIYNQKHVGGIGVRIDSFRSFIGELGYFIDEKYWGRGITTQAVRLLEDFIIANLNLHRIEIRMAIQNKASQKIAIKCGYKKEGILRESNFINGKWYDSYLYSKIL
jgi:ribosomal-protein-alanine N-acetyltransferase